MSLTRLSRSIAQDARSLVVVCIAIFAAAPSARAQDSTATIAPRTSADSSFTDAQAERGGQLFTRVCLECHERVDLSNADFRLKWGGQTTFDLFKNISTTMPDNNPGMLAQTEYADVVAYILKLNGVPSGPAELVADSTVMRQAKMTLPGAAGAGQLTRTRSGAAGVFADRRRVALAPHTGRMRVTR